MAQPNPTQTVTNPRIAKLIELEVGGRIKPEHQQELDTYRAQGLAPKKSSGNSLTEYQGKSTGFYERAAGADADFAAAAQYKNPDGTVQDGTSPVGYGGDIARKVLPEGVVNSHTSVARQKAEQAKRDFILASLRYESGAAISPSELSNQDQVFFPQTGDSPQVIEQKAAARKRVTESLKVAAGPGATDKALGEKQPAETPAPAMEEVGVGEGVKRAIDDVASPDTGGPIKVEIDQPSAQQSPEFRAGLNELLDKGASKQDILDYWDKNAPGALQGGDAGTGIADRAAKDVAEQGGGAVGSALRGAADTLTLGFGDELGAGVRALTADKPTTFADELRFTRAVKTADEAAHPWAYPLGQLAGAIAMPVGAEARGAMEMAKVGGGMGAAYGVGSGGSLGDRFTGGVKGAAAGAAGGLVLGKLSDLYLNRVGGRTPPTGGGRAQEAADLSQASKDLDIPLMPADAGGPTTRLMTSVVGSTPGGAQPIVSAARRTQAKAGAALDSMAAREGPALSKEAAGEAVTEGALKYRSGSRTSIGRAYDRAAELAGDAKVEPKKALEVLDRNISELSEVPGGADGLKALTDLRDDLAQRGTVTVQGIRGMRTQLRQKFLKDGLRGSDVERRVNEAVDAAGEDLVSSLFDQGKDDAARAYAAADKDWGARVKTLDEVIMPIIGKKGEKSGEQVIDALNSAAKGNNARLTKLFDALPEEEAGAARATLINQLGAANAGAQGAKGGEFSLDTFLTRWNQIGPSAKNSIFRGENRKSIDQLALIAEKAKAAGKFRNYSNTGLSVMSGATASTAFASVATLGKVLAGQYIGGRLLASPHVARALLGIAKAQTPAALSTRIANLTSIATRDPTIRKEVLQLQQKLLSAVNDNAGGTLKSVAGSEGPDNGQKR